MTFDGVAEALERIFGHSLYRLSRIQEFEMRIEDMKAEFVWNNNQVILYQ